MIANKAVKYDLINIGKLSSTQNEIYFKSSNQIQT